MLAPRFVIIVGVIAAAAIAASLSACAPNGTDTPHESGALPSVEPTPLSTPTSPAPLQTTSPPKAGAQASSSPPRNSVEVVVVSSGSDSEGLFASALVPEITETDGVCTVTATDGSQDIAATVPAIAAASSVNCGRAYLQVPSGSWRVTVHYSSPRSSGQSEPVTVVVP